MPPVLLPLLLALAAEPKDLDEKDPILERALGILREKLGKAGEKKG